jgi:threonine/homoserine/homoserine lactone efflux protein
LASGVLLGLSAGPSPGPMLALVRTQTLRHGPREGCKIALTPLVTDAPIIVVALVLAAKQAELRPLLGIVSIAGGAFVLYLAWDSFRPARLGAEAPAEPPRSWFKGIVTNLLSPHPWLFWLTVGAAILAKAIAQSWLVAAASDLPVVKCIRHALYVQAFQHDRQRVPLPGVWHANRELDAAVFRRRPSLQVWIRRWPKTPITCVLPTSVFWLTCWCPWMKSRGCARSM